MPMFPLGAVLLPGEQLPLRIFEPRYAAMLPVVEKNGGEFGVVLIERGSEVGGGDVRSMVGTVARIDRLTDAGPGRYSLLCSGTSRIRVTEWLPDDPYPRALVEDLPEPDTGPVEWSDVLEKRAQLQLLCGQGGRKDPQLRWIASQLAAPVDYGDGDPVTETFRAASDLPLGPADRQSVLESPDPGSRIDVIDAALDDLIAALRFRLRG
ncbi:MULTISPECIES: LON peptidase substrate-binding domain-containing protein [Gordonia]|nr:MULTISPECIES: LON peptidase substrate-binding domain-containing protein [Gordonia]KXT56055.1 peptidase S16 [Gordonia sp. QH-12]WFN94973.1 LON peptidase substrate-binding domain-containing protein [Gordonia sihwensis]